MKQSKWDKRKLGHYRPIKDCKRMNETLNEICLECNDCGRFNSIARRKKKVKKEYGIDYRRLHWSKSIFINGCFPRKWRHWNSYTTEKRRNQALKALQNKDDCFEFRKSKPS